MQTACSTALNLIHMHFSGTNQQSKHIFLLILTNHKATPRYSSSLDTKNIFNDKILENKGCILNTQIVNKKYLCTSKQIKESIREVTTYTGLHGHA